MGSDRPILRSADDVHVYHKKHADMTSQIDEWRALTLKPDLLGAASVYIASLQKWNKYPALVTDRSLKRILHRYENLWLPLLVEWPAVDLEPPLDVAWIWHVHMLHPREYIDYCTTRYKRVLQHKIRLSDSEERFALERTKLIWQDKYRHENFNIDLDNVHMGTYQINGSMLSWILSAASKVMIFLHQVSLPHYRDANFLFQALNRYKKFLVLRKQRHNARLAPPVDILLMWKTHALFPVDYYNEAYMPLKLYTLCADTDHDGRCLSRDGYDTTDWGSLYRDELIVPGSAYRGAPGYTALGLLPTDKTWEPIIDQCDITIDEISVSDLWSRDKSLVIVMRLLGNTSFTSKEILRVETTVNKVSRATLPTQGLASFKFEMKENRGVEFDIYAVRSRCGCGQSEIHLNTMHFNPREPFGQSSFVTRDFLYQMPKVSRIDPNVSFRCRVRAAAPDPLVLSLNRMPFGPVKALPTELLPFVAALPKWSSSIADVAQEVNEGLQFTQAEHGLKSRDGVMDFRIKVLKQHDLGLGAILVYHNNDHLVALAHSIGEETLASSNQLTGSCPLSLEGDADELAMTICNHHGDWAICKARWNYQNGDSVVKVRVLILDGLRELNFDIRDDELKTIQFGDVEIDIPTGRITVNSQSPTIAENIALAFCVGIMYVSCQLRALLFSDSRRNSTVHLISSTGINGSVRSAKSGSDHGMEPQSSPAKTTSRFTARRRNRRTNRRRKMSASYTYLLATGLLTDIALHGSTKSTQSYKHTTLNSLQQLYAEVPNGTHGNTVSGSHTTKDTTSNYRSERPSDVDQMNKVNGSRTQDHKNESTHVTSFGNSNDESYYMDVRL